MINHIVMWKFRPDIPEEERRQTSAGMAAGMEALGGRLPGVHALHIVTAPLESSNCDLLLVSSFDSEEALAGYQQNPEHLALKKKYAPAFVSRSCVDYRQ